MAGRRAARGKTDAPAAAAAAAAEKPARAKRGAVAAVESAVEAQPKQSASKRVAKASADAPAPAAAAAAAAAASAAASSVAASSSSSSSSGEWKLVTWNVASLRACVKKGGWDAYAKQAAADVYCLQETKVNEDMHVLDGYEHYFDHGVQKGYSGVCTLTRHKPLSVQRGIGVSRFDNEGRVLTLEFDKFFLVNAYVPNAGMTLDRLSYKIDFDAAMLAFLKRLDARKPVLYCGDLNCAHQEIDVFEPAKKHKVAGFTPEERRDFTTLLSSGFTDAFRRLHPDKANVYSFWSYRFHLRARDMGWRLDYFVASDRFMPAVRDVVIEQSVQGSDHCPVVALVRADA